MKKVGGIAAAALLILFSFQNCNKAAFHSEMAGRSLDVAVNMEKTNVSDMNVGAVQFFVTETKSVTQSGSTFSVKINKSLEINLDNGDMIVSNDYDTDSGQYCIPDAALTELSNLLKGAQVCRERPNLPEGTVCAQVYQTPYAKLMTTGSDVDLGTASDSCNNNKTDLCGDAKAQLQDYISRLNANYSGYSCQ